MILNGQATALLAVAAYDLGYFPSTRALARRLAVLTGVAVRVVGVRRAVKERRVVGESLVRPPPVYGHRGDVHPAGCGRAQRGGGRENVPPGGSPLNDNHTGYSDG